MIFVSAVVTDFRERRISNRLMALGLVIGLILRILGEGGIGIVHFLVNISIPVILLFLLFQLRALGAGDIKLFSVVGGFLELRQLFAVMIVAFIAASVIGLGKLLYHRLSAKKKDGNRTLIHFSLAILIGYVVVVWGCAIG
ncbi:MAG: prepilin peptidase [Clostridiales bacterium]|nr:prepilin peptidase [Roseburia sp.]MDD7636117.1 prepilin peptidase [Clostridiales bacterium]MDY4112236.1 prepilin peptidase [Roseburia sp.]